MKPDNSWILEVLAEIRTYAEENDLANLAGQLDNVAVVAMAEISERYAEKELADSPT